ncbi:MAG: Gfo/Idh/MocA family oxidoreductase [Verrucomicrobia bacterium]|nr:Gfo/Idh/MocA family oxidoreductase [Verrucomicrobiota bacterium]
MKTPRRHFLKTGLTGILAAAAAPQLVSSRVLGQNAPSKRVTLGFIGVGTHGLGVNLRSFLQLDDCVALAVCDVSKSRREKVRDEVNQHYGNKDCAVIADFRDVLARRDLDAVVISTPDHWHTTMALMAIAAGKKVFCEKPTLTIAEGRLLADTVKKTGALFAVGLEDRAVIQYHMMAEHVRNGAIGKLQRITCGLQFKEAIPRQAPAPVPADLDYNLWLGPAPFRPYVPTLTEPQVWRQIRDFSGGTLTDWGAHLVDTAQVANFAEDTSAVAVEGTGEIPPDAMNEVPFKFKLRYTYANGVTMEVTEGVPSIRFEGTDGWIGNKGWLGRIEASNPDILHRKYDAKTTKLWPRRPREQRDFLDSFKSGQPPMYTAETLHRLCTTLHLGSIAMELGRPLKWDPKKEEFIGDAAANARRSRKQRDDWKKA